MSFTNRFTVTAKGGMTFTGNTLGLSKDSGNTNNAGTVDSIGAFISLTQAPLPTYPSPPGTTLVYQLNSSQAILNIPAGSTVLYAELVWGGEYRSIPSGIDLSGSINNPVHFTTPSGTFPIGPDPATAVTTANTPFFFYSRSANVTALVQAAGAGTYSVGDVVGTVDPRNQDNNHAGWTLGVVYANTALPLRNMSIFAGGDFVGPATSPVDETITGFAAPVGGAINARVLVSGQEGDADKTGDQVLLGPALATLGNLSGPNNPVNNFFASQINNDSGSINTSGSFGTFNHNAITAANVFAGRQGWDITNVDGSSRFINNQTSAVFRFITQSDRYMPNLLGFQIDINEPVVDVLKAVNLSSVQIGQELTYTVTIDNTASVIPIDNVQFLDIPPNGTSFVDGSVIIDGTPEPAEDPTVGIDLGTIPAGDSVTLSYRVSADLIPAPPVYVNDASISFEYTPLSGTTFTDSSTSNEVTTLVISNGKPGFTGIFTQEVINSKLIIPPYKPSAECLLDTQVGIIIDKQEVINTSLLYPEDPTLLLFKVIVNGTVNIGIKYSALIPEQTIHFVHFEIPFCTLIEWPGGPPPGSQIIVKPIFEKVFFKLENERLVYKAVLLRLDVYQG